MNQPLSVKTENEWFRSWFDSPYYPILYQNRNVTDAEQMVGALIPILEPHLLGFPKPYKALDVACGRGRYARLLHRYGFEVEAIDLSPGAIKHAQENVTPGLNFSVGDMRKLNYRNAFHLVANFFTSFGYFDRQETNREVLARFHQALKPAGLLLLDYFNAHYIIDRLIPQEIISRSGIDFHISRTIEEGYLIKTIRFDADGEQHHFEEKVQLFYPKDFDEMLLCTGFETVERLGRKDQECVPFTNQSERLILIAKKEVI
jgi:SAM-dependent methyltransferase